ncbi:MAG: toxin [Thermodesulfobacteriota bacterium]|nr:toxin [Thermodesulfobacteriota bacterium]
MKSFSWNHDKNQQLIENRQISFEDVLFSIQKERLLDDIVHPNKAKYPNQRIFVVEVDGYAYLVPYVESDDDFFLKTIIPSRKATKHYLGGES